MKIINTEIIENPLLKRKETKTFVEEDVVPSRVEALKLVCDKFSCKPEVVFIERISSNFGTKNFTIFSDIYDSEEAKNKTIFKRKRDIEMEKKLEEEKNPKQEPKEDIQAEDSPEQVEEKKEEIKEEKKE